MKNIKGTRGTFNIDKRNNLPGQDSSHELVCTWQALHRHKAKLTELWGKADKSPAILKTKTSHLETDRKSSKKRKD